MGARSVVVMLLLSIVACAPQEQPTVTIHSSPPLTFAVEVADTPRARESGLMGRAAVPEGEGMLFVFEGDRKLGFWMKDTLIPLDIVFIDSSLQVVDVQHMAPCSRDPCRTYESAQPAMYALEVRASSAESVRAGTSVAIDR